MLCHTLKIKIALPSAKCMVYSLCIKSESVFLQYHKLDIKCIISAAFSLDTLSMHPTTSVDEQLRISNSTQLQKRAYLNSFDHNNSASSQVVSALITRAQQEPYIANSPLHRPSSIELMYPSTCPAHAQFIGSSQCLLPSICTILFAPNNLF